jgi:hypothetical protein
MSYSRAAHISAHISAHPAQPNIPVRRQVKKQPSRQARINPDANASPNVNLDPHTRAASRGSGRSSIAPLPIKKAWHSPKVLWAGGLVVALLAIVPFRVGSEAVDHASCQAVIRSGAEISRGQISQLLAVPAGATPEAIRQVIKEPYCTLPPVEDAQTASVSAAETREAYPLAFDPEAWLVVNYKAGEYAGYDFVFKRSL